VVARGKPYNLIVAWAISLSCVITTYRLTEHYLSGAMAGGPRISPVATGAVHRDRPRSGRGARHREPDFVKITTPRTDS
jgi:hypothetical protein